MEMEQSPASSNTTLVATDADIETGLPTTSAQRLNSGMTSRLCNEQAMPQMQTALSPQPVGREFVRQYYTLMSKSPQLLYRFYAANSTLTFGNGPTIVGQNKIRKDIENRGLNNCHTRIFKIDAQPTLGNGLVVQVIGELSNNNEPLRPFTQTFVLTPLVPKNFFVHNEIFRFQDDLQPDLSLESHSINTVPNCVGASTELWLPPTTVRTFSPVLTQQVIAISKSIASIAIQTANESALLFEESAASSVLSALKPEAIKQTTQTAADTQNFSVILPNLHEEIDKTLTSNSKMKIPENNSTATPTIIKKCNLLLEPKDVNSIPHIVSPTKSHSPASKSSANATLVNPSLTYANVFKSSSGQLLKEPKDSSPDCDLNVEISTSYIPSATFTTTTSPKMSPAPNGNASITPLATSRLTSPTLEVKHSNNRLIEGNISIPTNTSNNNNKIPDSSIRLITNTTTTNTTTTTQNAFRRNRNESNGNRFESGTARNQRNTNANANSGISSSSYQTQRRPRQQYERYDDNLQLFLGNLPLTATVEDLTHIFERYGTILELRVLSKSSQPGQRKLPNYGFLTFASTESVERCLNDLPLYFPENSGNGVRLNVRPKNENANAPQQQQQSARSGKSNMRYDNGGDHIRNSDQNRNQRFIKRGIQEAQNGSGEAPNVASSPCTSPVATVPLREEWPELGAVGSGGNTHRKGSKK